MDRDIEIEEVRRVLKKAKNNKAAGEDGCINEILKEAGEGMQQSLLTLFQKMWREERTPVDWERGIIVPIYKRGEKDNVDNYRGITLLSVVGKLYTSILNNRISKWIEKKNEIMEAQGDLLHNKFLFERINSREKKKRKIFCCFLDIRKLMVQYVEKDCGRVW